MLKIVFDTNIIVSALLNKKGLPALLVALAIENGKLQLFYSPALMAEYERVLKREKFDFDPKDTKEILSKIKRAGIEVLPKKTITLITEDPEDNRILEAGEEAQADYIITGDKSHFPFDKITKPFIVTPREFVVREEARLK